MIGSQILGYLFWSGAINLAAWGLVVLLFFIVYRMPAYHPMSIYLAYHFVGFVMRPISVYSENWSFIWSRIGFHPMPSDIVNITLVSNIALFGCVVGAMLAMRERNAIEPIPPTQFIVTKPAGFLASAVALVVLGIYSTYRAYGSAGLDSVSAFDVSVDAAGGQQLVGISGYTLALAEALPILCIILLFSRVPRTVAYGVTGLFVLLRVYVGAQRLSFVIVMAAGLFGALIARRRRFPTVSVIFAILCGAVLFDFVGHDRYVLRRVVAGEVGISELANTYVADRRSADSKAMDVVEYESAAAAVTVVRTRSGFSYGTQYLRMFIWPIPRQLWKNKPIYTSTVNLNLYGYNFLNLTYSLYADLYMALGFPAVFVGMMLLGWGMMAVYDMGRTTTRPFRYAFFWIFLIYLQTILRDGGTTFVYFWGFSSIFAYVIIKAGGLKLVREPAFAPRPRAPQPPSRPALGGGRPAMKAPR